MAKLSHRAKQTFGSLQTTWSIVGITLILLLLVEGSFRLILAVRDHFAPVAVPDHRVITEGYGGALWPIVHYREIEQLQELWHPYVLFRQKPFRGETITIGPDGARATWQSPDAGGGTPAAGKPIKKILALGGSSLWGFGARDDHTIPSLLARLLDQKGWRIELRNRTELGYVNTQELITLTREIQGGYRPDVVIFFDGVNDATSAMLDGEAGVTTNESNRRDEFNLLQSPGRLAIDLASYIIKNSGSYRIAQIVTRRLGITPTVAPSARAFPKQPDLADEVVRRYEANIAMVKALGRAYGFQPLFFWQPTIFQKETLVPVEQEEAQRYAWAAPFLQDVYDEVARSPQLSAESSFHDLSSIFAEAPELVFIDYCHTTEAANAGIAEAMIEPVVRAFSNAGTTVDRKVIPEARGSP